MYNNYPPESMVFNLKNGSKWYHFRRDITGYPTYTATDWVKSMETGEVRMMSEHELIKFKQG